MHVALWAYALRISIIDCHAQGSHIPASELILLLKAAFDKLDSTAPCDVLAKREWESVERVLLFRSCNIICLFVQAEMQEMVATCISRAAIVHTVYESGFDSDEGWTLGNKTDKSTTYYRLDKDTGKLYLKADGIVHCGLLECVAVWKEIPLYKDW